MPGWLAGFWSWAADNPAVVVAFLGVFSGVAAALVHRAKSASANDEPADADPVGQGHRIENISAMGDALINIGGSIHKTHHPLPDDPLRVWPDKFDVPRLAVTRFLEKSEGRTWSAAEREQAFARFAADHARARRRRERLAALDDPRAAEVDRALDRGDLDTAEQLLSRLEAAAGNRSGPAP